MKSSRLLPLILCGTLSFIAVGSTGEDYASGQKAKRMFRKPTRDFSSGPLWVWNDMMTEQQVRDTLREMADQKVKQVWVHPRPGLMTPYLGKDWFRMWEVSLEEAKRLDMNVWIYDENSYPSGFAGGLVPEAMPESRGRGLALKETEKAPKPTENLVAAYRWSGEQYEDVTDRIRAGEDPGPGKYVLASEVRSGNSPWHGDRCYVNLLSPGVTEKFIEITLGPYKERFGSLFGKRIPGVFTDEPNIRPAGNWPWSEVLLDEFKKRWGYDLLPHLPELREPIGDWKKTRHNYVQLLHEQFVERWAKPNFEYCEANGLEWTGHYWDHEWPHCLGVPDNMAMYVWHQRPAIDCLMNQYAEHTHAQFGNVRMVRELSSVANQMGWRRTLCEIYGAGGWDLRFEDMKRIADWLAVLGVNTMNQHLTYTTLRGARKRDHPQSFSYHDPWWEAYHVSAEYLARISVATSYGEQINRVLVLEPTTTAWMYQEAGGKLGQIGDSFFKLLMALEAAQVEYDLGSEDVIFRKGSVAREPNTGRGLLRIGQRDYDTVVIAPYTENLNRKTHDLLIQAKPVIYKPGPMPVRIEGGGTGNEQDFFADPAFAEASVRDWTAKLIKDLRAKLRAEGFAIDRAPGDKGILFHQRRVTDGGELVFLVNTSIEHPSRGAVISNLKGAESWDPYTGKIVDEPVESSNHGITVPYELPPSGSKVLFLTATKTGAARPEVLVKRRVPAVGEIEIRREEPNVLVLDHVDVAVGAEAKTNIYFYQANQFAWQKNGMERNPWDSAVQFKDELIRKTFPANSGFKATYRFNVSSTVPPDLDIVVERPDLYSITCNGKPVVWDGKTWWLDRAFGRMSIATSARTGANEVTIKARPFTMYHELEPAYLLGSFTLNPSAAGFEIGPEEPLVVRTGAPVLVHSVKPEGAMWLSAGVGYAPGREDRAPWMMLDLGREVENVTLRLWNYSETHIRDLTSRGVRRMRLHGASAANPEGFTRIGEYELQKGAPGSPIPQELRVAGERFRYLKLEVLENHAGVKFPFEGEAGDNGFVGLSELQFIDASGELLSSVKVVKVSSELNERKADYAVDGSGLKPLRLGWNGQGHPFYSSGVTYINRFIVERKRAKHEVQMGEWYGAVASVKVNGKLAGYIDAPPWKYDVSSLVKKGENRVEVTVYGTLKNLLGPHHGGPTLGSAWPGNFQRGPEKGLPPGANYDAVGYGLFAPFSLEESLTARETTQR